MTRAKWTADVQRPEFKPHSTKKKKNVVKILQQNITKHNYE
jgi:hypothetical protein